MSDQALIKPELFQWAQERSGKSMEHLRGKFPKLDQWLSGEAQPTMKQLERFAKQTYTPLGYFFLQEPLEEKLPIPDYRTLSDQRVPRPSPHLLDTIHAAQLRQEWMRDFLIEEGEPELKFIGSRSLKDSPEIVAEDMRKVLGLVWGWSRQLPNWEKALQSLIQAIEEAGVLVMINGVVENNTHRPLSVEEFRGFVLNDRHAPLIFINGVDAKAAQMFTLAHELAHLWVGKGGISDMAGLLPSSHKIELFCNKVAAEFLVPGHEIWAEWDKVKSNRQPFDKLARLFKVSPIVAARRALDLKLITEGQYFAFYNEYTAAASRKKAKARGGGNFYLTLGMRLGKRFPAAVYSAAREGSLSYRDAYHLTGLNGGNYDKFGKRFGFAV
ncbi:MAG: ImmA/IrrE family metallo-endopeptidase [Verrucomicrobiales bacterium]